MSLDGDNRGDTASLFPEQTRPGRTPSTDLRKAAALLHVPGDLGSNDDESTHAKDLQTGDLFAWGARQRQVKLRANPPEASSRAHGRPFISGPDRRTADARGAGLTRCLDGGRGGLGVLGRGRHVVRNRVLFTLLILGVVLYVILHLALRG